MILFLVYDGIAEECVFSASMICDYLIRLAETFTGCQTRYDKLMEARGKIIGLEDVETAAVLGWQAETVKTISGRGRGKATSSVAQASHKVAWHLSACTTFCKQIQVVEACSGPANCSGIEAGFLRFGPPSCVSWVAVAECTCCFCICACVWSLLCVGSPPNPSCHTAKHLLRCVL